jgi:hypothetical protein
MDRQRLYLVQIQTPSYHRREFIRALTWARNVEGWLPSNVTEGFSLFVSSMTAPVASGWSGCRVGLAPTGKRRLFTAHTQARHSLDHLRCAS